MANEVKFRYGTSTQYTESTEISDDNLYFTTETIDGETKGTLYKGDEVMGTSVADKLVLPEDLNIIGTTVGNLADGSTISAGTSITELLIKMLQQEIKPVNPTSPTVSVTATATTTSDGGASIGTATQVEIGTIVAYNVTPVFKDGSFTSYTSATVTESIAAGITTSGITVTRTSPVSETLTTTLSSGSAVSDEYQLVSEAQIKYGVSAPYTGTTQTVKSNILEEYEYSISDDTATASVSKCTGYYRYFWGILTGLDTPSDPTSITQSDLSGLTNALLTANVTIGTGNATDNKDEIFVIAVPSSKSVQILGALSGTNWITSGILTSTTMTYDINGHETEYTLYTKYATGGADQGDAYKDFIIYK